MSLVALAMSRHLDHRRPCAKLTDDPPTARNWRALPPKLRDCGNPAAYKNVSLELRWTPCQIPRQSSPMGRSRAGGWPAIEGTRGRAAAGLAVKINTVRAEEFSTRTKIHPPLIEWGRIAKGMALTLIEVDADWAEDSAKARNRPNMLPLVAECARAALSKHYTMTRPRQTTPADLRAMVPHQRGDRAARSAVITPMDALISAKILQPGCGSPAPGTLHTCLGQERRLGILRKARCRAAANVRTAPPAA